MAADVAVAPRNRIPISGGNSSETVSPSAYISVTNSRERFMVLVMSALLLLISCTLFAVLFTLLSDDIFDLSTVVGKCTGCFNYSYQCP
nr:uncharacterized protein LOC129382939 isoform X3 [Dermacentor andersoni]